jgi:hypothetical protein
MMNKKIPFAYLQDLRKTLFMSFSMKEIEEMPAFNPPFSDKIKEKMVFTVLTHN